MSVVTHSDRVRRNVRSMIWAAWADALGFISELTNESGLRRRLRGKPLTEPVEWTRRIGGKFGVDVKLPAGCYSDDTQLRLATARAVQPNGFDVEAFAKVELSVWPSYAIGGGLACKAAAVNIAKPNTPWFANFYKGWLESGGNGVAMRIQPHIWAASRPAESGRHIRDVIVNGATSHGHPRAFVGAVLHAFALGATLRDGRMPEVDWWPELLDLTDRAVGLVDEHQQLASLWRPVWEKQAGRSFADAWHSTVDECRQMLPAAAKTVTEIRAAGNVLADAAATAYDQLAATFGLRNPSSRGNGAATVIAALALATATPADPAGVARLAAQAIGTDTDTIATMAAALMGACDSCPVPPDVMDRSYFTALGERLALIASGRPVQPFSYPDLLSWVPPHTQLDGVGLAGEYAALAGLGWLKPLKDTEPVEARGATWLWTRSDFGPSFLVKQRTKLRELPKGNWPVRRERLVETQARARWLTGTLFDPDEAYPDDQSYTASIYIPRVRRSKIAGGPTSDPMTDRDPVERMLEWVARSGYSEPAIGYAIRRIAEVGTDDQLARFAIALRAVIRGSSK